MALEQRVFQVKHIVVCMLRRDPNRHPSPQGWTCNKTSRSQLNDKFFGEVDHHEKRYIHRPNGKRCEAFYELSKERPCGFERVKITWLDPASVELVNEVVVGSSKASFEREVIRIQAKEEQSRNQCDPRVFGLSLVSDENEDGRDEGDAPCFTGGAVRGHSSDDGLK
jgi:hypothetical protein